MLIRILNRFPLKFLTTDFSYNHKTILDMKKWYKILFHWELLRLLYNIIMLFVGVASILIANITIPLIYVIIGVLFNLGFSFLWIFDLIIIKIFNRNYIRIIFIFYLLISIALVLGFSFHVLSTMV